MSATWLTLVPEAAPRYNSFAPGWMYTLSIPPRIPAANLERKGFQTRYSILVRSSDSTWMRFSLYTDSPGLMFLVTRTSSLPRAMNTPGVSSLKSEEYQHVDGVQSSLLRLHGHHHDHLLELLVLHLDHLV